MKNEKGMKNMKGIALWTLLAATLVCAILFTACDDKQVEIDYGKISVSLAGGETAATSARTVFPSTVFDKYVYTFFKIDDETENVLEPDSNGSFTLAVGHYTVAVQAFIDNDILTAYGSSDPFAVSPGSNAPVTVILSMVETEGEGEFSYKISYPAGATADISLQKFMSWWEGWDYIPLSPLINGETETLQLDAGSYRLTVRVSKGELNAGITEAVHIYPALTTRYEWTFDDSDLTLPLTPPELAYELINNGTAYRIYAGSTGLSGDMVIPASFNGKPVTEIGSVSDEWDDGAFLGTNITSVTIPSSVKIIGGFAFAGCSSLENVTIPESVTTIGNAVFGACGGLTSITIPGSVTSIGAYSFAYWTTSQTINVRGYANMVAANAAWGTGWRDLSSATIKFWNGSGYQIDDGGLLYEPIGTTAYRVYAEWLSGDVVIPAEYNGKPVTQIRWDAFRNFSGLTSITIPASVVVIEQGAFLGCHSLTSITVDADNPNYSSEGGVLYNKGKTEFKAWPSASGSVTIPANITSIGDSTFERCLGITSVSIHGNVTKIGSYAFGGCTGITSITIPASVTQVGQWAFNQWTSSQTINVPFANAQATNNAWGSEWRNGCEAEIGVDARQ